MWALLMLSPCFFYGSASVEYSEKTMEEALKKVEKMDADLGGTEILEPLKHIHSQPCIPNQQRQVTHTHRKKLCCLHKNLIFVSPIFLSAF